MKKGLTEMLNEAEEPAVKSATKSRVTGEEIRVSDKDRDVINDIFNMELEGEEDWQEPEPDEEEEDTEEEEQEQEDEGDNEEEDDSEQEEETEDENIVEFSVPEEVSNSLREVLGDDLEFETLEAYNQAVGEALTEIINENRAIREASETYTRILKEEPQLAQIANSITQGKSVRAAILEAGFLPEDFMVDESDEDGEQVVAAKLNTKKARQEAVKRVETIQKNTIESQKRLDKFRKERGIDQKKFDSFLDSMNNTLKNMIDGNIDEKTIEAFFKALDYDEAKSKEYQKGVVRGKNEKIVTEKRKKTGDGIPKLGKGGTKTPKPAADPFIQGMGISIQRRSGGILDKLGYNK